ncbi:MAG: murein biosynthesis integral membrane protein MurJ [Christensenellaceae bacterium]|jgi:putative peptidoglycan lipid II flippase
MAKENKTLKTTLTITVIIIISKLVGFVREMVLAAYFGQSVQSDAYVTSYGIISIFTILFGAAIGSTFIPIYTKTRLNDGEDSANRYASNILNLYILAAIATSILGYIFAPQICGLIWQGEEGLDLTVRLSRFMFPSLVFWAVSGVFVNILNARKKFIPEQLMGFALSFCVILACVLFSDIDAVAIATTAAAAVQILILLPFLRKEFHYKRSLNIKDDSVKRTFILAVPALISMAFDEINHQADRFFGSALGTGVVSALSRSYTLVQAVVSVLIIPITTVMFSELSGYAAKNEMGKLKETVRKSLEIIALMTLPIIVLSLITGSDIIGIFYERGQFTHEDTLFTAPVFSMYILGIFAFGMRNFLTRVYYSLQLTRIPMILGIISVSINIGLDILLKGPLGAMGLTLATSIASSCGAIMMIVVLRKKLGRMGLSSSIKQFLKILLSAAVCAAVSWLIYRWLGGLVTGGRFADQLVRFLITGFAGLAVYMCVAFLLKVDAARKLGGIVKRKLRRNRANS